MITKVTDVRSHARAQIEHAVRAIGRSKYKKGVFEAVCYHKKKIKTVTEISEMTGFDRINVLQAAGELGAEGIIHKTKKDGEIAYEKDDFFSNAKNKAKILRRVEKRGELEKTPVAITLEHGIKDIKIFKPSSKDNVRSRIALITINDLDDFNIETKLGRITSAYDPSLLLESDIKEGFKKIIGEKAEFPDWGGEKSDLFTTRLKIKRKRYPAAIAFKGRGTCGKLTLEKMGKRGDQVQRLFESPARIFLVVYHSPIDERIVKEMEQLAKARSLETGHKIYYGIIDGEDLKEIISKFPKEFYIEKEVNEHGR